MRHLFALFLLAHGLIHLLGFAKAFGLADLPQLTQPVSPFYGVMWLTAALLFAAAAAALFVWPRWWWAIGASAIVASTLAIAPSWADAKFGALANVVAMAGVAFGFILIVVAYGHLLKEPLFDTTHHIFPRLVLLTFVLASPAGRDVLSLDAWLRRRRG